ncbi:MaoC family dehydratase N-terminal domain-containing protein [Rhodococcus sp. ACPA1]|uniref:FAS1-like dehydratase domain-containing protein n=1 Tax=Rhodococcus sp. ACPA1 TaxID=2028572 RepID=UPI000BB0EEBB|nr:MaoC family dehydratase N-terminal domain-containing protein [Rhodococcus sp. ACPA1]PBC47423.1 acyl dehydratase [Rhodococcus sp. ACPA1]
MTEVVMQGEREFASVTDNQLAELRSMIGKPIRSDRPHVTELTVDAVRHYALGIGDRNPLWSDPERAAEGRIGVPPTALLAMDKVFSGYVTGLPGIHAMYAGTSFSFERKPVVGDRLTGSAVLKELIERPSKFAGRSWQQIYEVPFHDEAGALVCTGQSYCFRIERDNAREGKKYEDIRVEWTTDQIAEIAQRYRDEEARRRGTVTRYVEDVEAGDALPPITKGPYTATTAIAYLLGWGGLYVRGHGDAFDLFERHPALGIPNELGVPEPPERVHWDADLARRVGVPGAYDYGPERVSWMGQVVTDWMGDDGFLKTLDVQVRRHNVLGELVTCDGSVSRVDPATGEIDIVLNAINQDGFESARGTATVVLPNRVTEQ